jgi:hypothetical protein
MKTLPMLLSNPLDVWGWKGEKGMGGSGSQTSEKSPESDRCRLGVALWSKPLVSEVISLDESISGSYHPS